MLRHMRFVLWVAVAIAAAGGLALYFGRTSIQETLRTAADVGGPFVLASSRGGEVNSKDLLESPMPSSLASPIAPKCVRRLSTR